MKAAIICLIITITFAKNCVENPMCLACDLGSPNAARCLACRNGSELVDGTCQPISIGHNITESQYSTSQESLRFGAKIGCRGLFDTWRFPLLMDGDRHGVVLFWLTLAALIVVSVFFYKQRSHRWRELGEGSADEYVSVN